MGMSNPSWKWFKQGIQWDVRCNAIAANGQPCKASIVIFTETKDRNEAVRQACCELARYGYTNSTVDKMVCHK